MPEYRGRFALREVFLTNLGLPRLSLMVVPSVGLHDTQSRSSPHAKTLLKDAMSVSLYVLMLMPAASRWSRHLMISLFDTRPASSCPSNLINVSKRLLMRFASSRRTPRSSAALCHASANPVRDRRAAAPLASASNSGNLLLYSSGEKSPSALRASFRLPPDRVTPSR